jgi:hypothetical protein
MVALDVLPVDVYVDDLVTSRDIQWITQEAVETPPPFLSSCVN